MSKYHNAFQGFVKVFTGAAKRGEKGNPTTIIGVAPSKNIKKFTDQKEKIIKMTDSYKKIVNDPEVKKKMNETTSKTLSNISKIYKGEPITKKVKKADGGRIGRKLGGGADMAKKKTNVQKIKETFGPKKNLSAKQMKIASLAGNKKKIDGPDFEKLRSKKA
jgi:hypothetical protein